MARLRLHPVALRFGRFAVVGCTGFLIDSGLLALLHHGLGVDPFSARLVSMACAGLTTWRLNRLVTFGASSATQAREGMRYAGVTALTASLNYCVYALALTLVPHLWPLAALVVASGTAMFFSFAGYSHFVFGVGWGRPAILSPSPSEQSR